MTKYNRKGKETVSNKAVVFAEHQSLKTGEVYRVLMNEEGELIQPQEHKNNKNSVLTRVPKECFDLYLNFLQTNNQGHLINAESLSIFASREYVEEDIPKESKDVHVVELSTSDEEYIKAHARTKTIEDLVVDIKKPRVLIEQFLKNLSSHIKSNELLSRREDLGVVMMTEEAAQAIEETKRVVRKTPEYIHRPKG